jgi:PAS domain S-box-containing protein
MRPFQKGHRKEIFWSLSSNFRRSILCLLLSVIFSWSVPCSKAQTPNETIPVQLTAHERDWISKHPVIRIAPDPYFPPIEWFDNNGKYRGIAADFTRLVQKKTGINFKVIRCKNWDEVLEKAESREVDALPAAAQTPERFKYLLYSDPHIVLPGVIITKTKVTGDITLKDLSAMKVSVVKAYVWQEFLETDFPDIKLDLVRDLQAGLKKVALGISDAVVATLPVALYYIEKEGITNLRVAGETGYYTRLSFASRKDWPELNAILKKALAQIPQTKREEILGKWIHLEEKSLFKRKEFWITILVLIGACGLIILAIVLWNSSLKGMVDQRTKELEKELARRKQAEKKIGHINLVLSAIRNVNQLITKEKNRDKLLQGVCNSLVETRGYYNGWAVLLDESGKLLKTAEAGLGDDFLPMLERLKRGELTGCGRTALSQSDVVITEDPSSTCFDCPLAEKYSGRWAMTNRLEHKGKVYGLLSVSITGDIIAYKEEQELFREVTGDIAYALYNIEQEDKGKRVEMALKASDEKYRSLVETITDLVFIIAPNGSLTYLNPEFENLTGFPAHDFIGHSFTEVLAPEYIESTVDRFKRGLSGETIPIYEVELKHKDGKTVPVELKVTSLFDDHGKTIGRIGLARDISERKRTEEMIRQSERFLQSVFDGIQDGISVLDTDFNIVKVNSWIENMYSKQMPLVGKKCYVAYQQRQSPCPWCPSVPAIKTGEVYSETVPYPSDANPIGWIDLSSFPLKDANGSVVGIIEHVKDITARKLAEVALWQSERELRFRNQIANIFLTVPDDEMYGEVLGIVLEAMKSKYGIFGYIDEKGNLVSPSITRDIWVQCDIPDKDIIFPREQWGGIWGRAMVDKKTLYSNKPFNVPEGHIHITNALDVPIIHRGELIGNFLVGNKETDYDEKDKQFLESIVNYIAPVLHARLQRDRQEEGKKKLENQLRQAQKMEAIGTLAGGIAHDFNNILGAIIGYVEIASLQVPEDNKAKESLKGVLKAGHRAKNLVKQILTFSRNSEQERIPMQISPIVKEAIKLLRSSLPTTIEIRQNIESDTGIMEADPTQIHQILMNLCTNAAHAMREEGGILEVGIRNVEVGSWDSESGHLDMTPGPYLLLTVSDTGEGMTPEVMARIFDPYFTTKEKGVGTGLGLAVVHGIVNIYGGTIRAYSEPGKGTTFHVYLPRIEEAKEMAEDVSRPGVIPTGQEHVLFIDDELVLVEIGKQMLERLGYEVTIRTSSIEALELFRAKPDQFDLVITDMTMPNMTGDKLSRELMQIRPDIPIIICTGYSELISEEKAKGIGIRAFAMKPLVMADLGKTVRNVLDNK